MRVVLVSSLVLLLACGGSNKPAESPSSESKTPETNESAETESEGGAPSAETPAETPPAASSAAPAAESPAAESPPAHPVPTVTGSIDGKPFSPKMARITQPMQKDKRIVVTIDERTECGGGDPKTGEALMTMLVPWEDGYKVDLGSLKRAGKKGGGEIGFYRVGASGKKESQAVFKPTGRVTIVKAPGDENAVGKMKVDLQSGDYMLAGDLDIQVCVTPASPKAAKAGPKGPKKK
jgi:hypothetical protein